jgi:hypothetical protein
LQPRRDVRRLADDAALAGIALPDQIADDDEAAGDAEPHLEPFREAEAADRGADRERGAHRPLGVVFMRLRVAEIGQNAIAHQFGDIAAEPRDRVADAGVIGAEDVAQLFRVEPRRECRRADQIAKKHGQLPPLGGGRRRWLRDGLVAAQGGDRGEQLAPVTDRLDPQILEVVCRQLEEDLGIDGIPGECLLVLRQPQILEPGRNINLGHSRLPAHPWRASQGPCSARIDPGDPAGQFRSGPGGKADGCGAYCFEARPR